MALEWKAPAYNFEEKHPDWFWAVGIVTAGIAIASIILGDILFAILVLCAGGALLLMSMKKSPIVIYRINESGVRIHNKLYPYSTLESFGFPDEEVDHQLLLKSKKLFSPLIALPLPHDVNLDEVRAELLPYLPEDDHEEPATQKVMEYLGF